MRLQVLRAGNPGPFTLDGTRAYLLGRRSVAVVDPGPDVEDHVRALVVLLQGARRVEILVTHGHPDHAAAAPVLAEELGRKARVRGAVPGRGAALREGDTVSTDEGDLLVLETHGHSRPHLSFLHRGSGTLFCGDLLLGEGETTWVGEYPEAVTDYLASLRRLQGIGLRRIVPAHGPPLEDPDDALARFLRHRTRRIEQVERELARGVTDPGRVTDAVHGEDLSPRLRDAALLSVRATMHHLGVSTPGDWDSEPEGA